MSQNGYNGNNQNKQNKPRRDPFVLDDSKLRLYADKPLREGARVPSARVKKSENNPVFEVDLGYKTESKNGKEGYPVKIETPMAPRPFRSFLNLIIKVAQYKGGIAFEMENWGYPFIYDRNQGKNVRSPDRLVISRYEIGKREDGTVYLAVAAKNRDTVEFEFKSDEYHPVLQNGQPVPVSISSALAAQSWAETMIDVYFQDYGAKWEEPEYQKRRRLEAAQRRQGGGHGGHNQNGNGYNNSGYNGNNNQSGGSGQNYQQQNQSAPPASNIDDGFDEDIPF